MLNIGYFTFFFCATLETKDYNYEYYSNPASLYNTNYVKNYKEYLKSKFLDNDITCVIKSCKKFYRIPDQFKVSHKQLHEKEIMIDTLKEKLIDFLNSIAIEAHDNVTFIPLCIKNINESKFFYDILALSNAKAVISLATHKEHEKKKYLLPVEFYSRISDKSTMQIAVFLLKIKHLRFMHFNLHKWKKNNPPEAKDINDLVNRMSHNLPDINHNIVIQSISKGNRTATFIMFYILSKYDNVDANLFVNVFFYLLVKGSYLKFELKQLQFLVNYFLLK